MRSLAHASLPWDWFLLVFFYSCPHSMTNLYSNKCNKSARAKIILYGYVEVRNGCKICTDMQARKPAQLYGWSSYFKTNFFALCFISLYYFMASISLQVSILQCFALHVLLYLKVLNHSYATDFKILIAAFYHHFTNLLNVPHRAWIWNQ